MGQGAQPVRFEMAGGSGEDPLGLWTAKPDGAAFHFGLEADSAAPPVDTPVYRIQLPEDAATVEDNFYQRESLMAQKELALEAIPSRLDDLVGRMQGHPQPVGDGTVHFGMEASPPGTGSPETELLSQLTEVDQGGTFMRSSDGQLEFGLMDEVVNPAIEQARAQFNALLHQVNCEVLHFAWVETALSGRTLARTSVDWSGDAETVWAGEISAEQILLHYRTFKFATHSRALKLRMAMTIMGGAVKISALMTNPAGAALALPVVYRYVSQVLAQAAQLKTLKEGV